MEGKQMTSKQMKSSQSLAAINNRNLGQRPPLPTARTKTVSASKMTKLTVLSPICEEVSEELVVSTVAVAQEPGRLSDVEESREAPNRKLPGNGDTFAEVAAAATAPCNGKTAVAATAAPAAAAPKTQPLQRKDSSAGCETPEVQQRQERRATNCIGTGKGQGKGFSKIPVMIARIKSEAARKIQNAAAVETSAARPVTVNSATKAGSSIAATPQARGSDATTPSQPVRPAAAASGGRNRQRLLSCPATSAAAGSGSRGDVRRQAAGASDASAIKCRVSSAGSSKLAPRPVALPSKRSLTTIAKGQTRTAVGASATTDASRLTSGRSQRAPMPSLVPLAQPPPPLPPPLMLTAAASSYNGGRPGLVGARGGAPPLPPLPCSSSSRVAKSGIYNSGRATSNSTLAAARPLPAISKLSDWLAGSTATVPAARSETNICGSTIKRPEPVSTRSEGGATPPRRPRVATAGCRSRSLSPSGCSKMADNLSGCKQPARMRYLSRRICGDTLRPEPPIRVPASKPHLRYTSPSSSSSTSMSSTDEKGGAKGYLKKLAPQLVRSQRVKLQSLKVHYRAKFDYTKFFDFDICFKAKDVIQDCKYVDRVWIIGTVKRTKQRGLIPRNHLSKMRPFRPLF